MYQVCPLYVRFRTADSFQVEQETVTQKSIPYLYPGLFVFIILLTMLFFVGGPGNHSARSFKSFWNLGHVLYYGILPLALFRLLPGRRLQYRVQLSIIVAVTIFLGVLVEILQYGLERTPDLGDIGRNMIGAGIAVCFLLPLRKAFSKTGLTAARTVLVFLVLTQIYPIGIALLDEYRARRDFPILSDFESPLQLDRWNGGARISIEKVAGKGSKAMRADLTTKLYSGVSLEYFPQNWMGYKYFQFRIYNPLKDSIKITCRIHDREHTRGVQEFRDRFNRSFTLTQGWSTVTISLEEVKKAPEQRDMDMGRIYGVGIFATRLQQPRTVYVDDVALL